MFTLFYSFWLLLTSVEASWLVSSDQAKSFFANYAFCVRCFRSLGESFALLRWALVDSTGRRNRPYSGGFSTSFSEIRTHLPIF